MGTKRLRLVKVVLTPVWIVDDGDTLTEQPGPTTEITAAEWPGFAERLEADRVEAEQQLNGPQ